VSSIVTYTYPSNTITRGDTYLTGAQSLVVPKTAGTLPVNPRCTIYTVELDYVYEVSGTDQGFISCLAGPGVPGCWISVPIGAEQSNSGHMSVTSALVPTGHSYFAGGNAGILRTHLGLEHKATNYSMRLTISNLVITATVESDDVPTDPPHPPGPPQGDLPFYALEVINKPYLASGGSIAGNIEQVWSPSGNRDLTGVSVFKIEIVTPAARDTPIAVALAVVSGSSAQTATATLVAGVAAFSIALNSALAAGEYKYRIECTSACIVNKAVIYSPTFYYKGSGATAFRYLEFTTQPPDTAIIGTAIANIVVKSVNDAGTVQTGTAGTCTAVNFSFAGPNKDTYLQGTKTVSFVSGVATYTGLIHVQPGRYFLKVNASVTTHRENWSEVTNVSGDAPNMPGLRQMHSEDAVWRKTTDITAPTFATLTADELQILDGDFAVTNKVTCDGIRDVFHYKMFLKKVSVKYKLSSIGTAPTIKIYTSIDSTTPISGTWTLLATLTPVSTKVEIRTYVPSAPVYTTGLWVTQDKNGGSSTCDWYSVQVVGDYIKPDFSIVTLNTGEIDDEYISVPSPLKNLQGAQVVTRDIIITNNTTTDYATVVQAVPARYGGDSKVTGEITVRDPESGAMVYTRAFPAGAGQVLRLRYEITAAENDLSGLHYIKLKVKEYELGMSYFYGREQSGNDWILGNMGTGVELTRIAVNVNWFTGGSAIGTHDPWAYLIETYSTTQTFLVHRVTAPTGAEAGTFTVTGIGLVPGLPYIFNDQMWLLPFSVTGSIGYLIPNVSTVALGTVIDGTTLASFNMSPSYFDTLPNAYTVIDPGAPTWVSLRNPHTFNGWGGQLVSHSPDPGAHGRVWAVDVAHRAHANFGAVASRAYCFDYRTGRIWRFRSLAGGLIGVESYTTPGGTDASPCVADIYITITAGTLVSAQFCFIRGTKIYVVFDYRYLYRYDLPTLANPTLMWDHGAGWIAGGLDMPLFEF